MIKFELNIYQYYHIPAIPTKFGPLTAMVVEFFLQKIFHFI